MMYLIIFLINLNQLFLNKDIENNKNKMFEKLF